MTIDATPPRASYTVAGAGPYAAPWPYQAGTLRVGHIVDGVITWLTWPTWSDDQDDWTNNAFDRPTGGNVWLLDTAVPDLVGQTLVIERQTVHAQDWGGQPGRRERGIEAALDRLTQIAQEHKLRLGKSITVETATDLAPVAPTAGQVLVWDGARMVPTTLPEWPNKRSAAVAACIAGWLPDSGITYALDGLAYLGVPGATVIPDLPGLVPAGEISLAHWGADRSGTANVAELLRAAVTFANGRKITLPRGSVYRCTMTARINLPSGGVWIEGEDTSAVIWHDENSFGDEDGVGNNLRGFDHLFYYSTYVERIRLRSLTLRGSRQTNRAEMGCARFLSSDTALGNALHGCGELQVEGIIAEHARALCFFPTRVKTLRVSDNRFQFTTRGVFNCQDVEKVWFDRNTSYFCRDDTFNANILKTGTGEDFHLTDNIAIGSMGLLIVSGKRGTISGNHFQFCNGRCIQVTCANDYTVGNPLDIRVTDNTAENLFGVTDNVGLANGRFIDIILNPATTGTGGSALTGVPGSPNASGDIIDPEPYYYALNANAANSPTAPAPGIIVTGNIYRKTMISGKISDRLGTPYIGRYADVDYTITLNLFDAFGIRGEGSARDVLIANNQFSGCFRGISWNLRSGISHDLSNAVIESNIISDFALAGISLSEDDTNVSRQDVLIRGNTLDGDPYNRHAARAVDGSWSNSLDGTALRLSNVRGYMLVDNIVRNVPRVVWPEPARSDASRTMRDNIMFGDLVSGYGAYSASNKGIGRAPAADNGWKIFFRDSNPTSPTFREIIGDQPEEATSMPTTGKWAATSFVRNVSSANDGILGWRRLTTGSAHVAGTDWATVYYPSGAPDPVMFAPPSAATLIAAATLANKDYVTIRSIMGGSYTTAIDATPILAAVLPALVSAGLRIIAPEPMELSFKTQSAIFIDNLVIDWGYCLLRRDWSGTGASSAMFTHSNYSTGFVTGVSWTGGYIIYSPGVTGVVFRWDINRALFDRVVIFDYRGGQGFLFGGDDVVLRDCEAYSSSTGTGDGAYRGLNGTRITVTGCRGICNDDVFQFTPSTGAAVGSYRYGRSITNSQYGDCHGVSYKARLCIAAIIDQPDETTVTSTSRLRSLSFNNIKGTAPGGFIVACNCGDGTLAQVDDIHFTNVNAFATSDTSFSGNTASQIYGTAAYSGAIGRVTLSGTTVEGTSKSYGLDVYNADGARILMVGSSFSGSANALRVRSAVVLRIIAGSFEVSSGGPADRQPILVSTTGTNARLTVDGPTLRGVPTGYAGLQVSGVGSVVDVRAVNIVRASGATDVRAVQGAAGTTIYYNQDGLTGDIDTTGFGAATALARLVAPWSLPNGAVSITATVNGNYLVTQLAEVVMLDAAPPGARTYSLSTVGAVKGMMIHFRRTAAGSITLQQVGGSALVTLTTAGQWADILFDGTNWVVENSSLLQFSGAWSDLTGKPTTLAAAGITDSHMDPYIKPQTGEWVSNGLAAGTLGMFANNCLIGFWRCPHDMTIDQVAINVTTAGSAGTTCKVVIYDATSSDKPNLLLAESPTIDVTTTGVKSVALSGAVSLQRGKIYCLGVRASSTVTISACTGGSVSGLWIGTTPTTANRGVLSRSVAYASATQSPWVWSVSELSSSAQPLVFMRST